MPVGFQNLVLTANLARLAEIKKEAKKAQVPLAPKKGGILAAEPLAQIVPEEFYMELNATKGVKDNIPGEQRIPLEAIWSAQEFWGWKDNYTKSINPGKGRKTSKSASPQRPKEDRIYHNWISKWKISAVETNKTGDKVVIKDHQVTKNVRMYFYENSSDFRFTSGDIAKWGNPGDIVRITREEDGPVDFVCELVKKGDPLHVVWATHCNLQGRSKRRFGFC